MPQVRQGTAQAVPPYLSFVWSSFWLTRESEQVSPTKDAFYDLSIPIPDDKMLDKVTKEIEAEGVLSNTKRPSPGLFSKMSNWLMCVYLLTHTRHARHTHDTPLLTLWCPGSRTAR